MDRFLIVCAGSAVGGGSRYLVSLATAALGWTGFPWATLIVNAVGSFLITMVMHIATVTTMSTNLRLLLTTGFMGGFTTYSTFDYETTNLFQTGSPGTALLNVGVTVVGCFAAGLLGIGAGHLLVGGE
jgi:CrcB protein